jgi:hypothetical protein
MAVAMTAAAPSAAASFSNFLIRSSLDCPILDFPMHEPAQKRRASAGSLPRAIRAGELKHSPMPVDPAFCLVIVFSDSQITKQRNG